MSWAQTIQCPYESSYNGALSHADFRRTHGRGLPPTRAEIHLPADDFVDRYTRELDAEDEVILICEHGRNSEAATRFLMNQGFINVASLAGGIAAWTGPVEGNAV